MTINFLDNDVCLAVEAAQDKQALDITVLNLRDSGAFADYFLLCSGSSGPQIQAIGEAVEERPAQERAARGPSRRPRAAENGICWITDF